jgi:hypothetical protein
MCFGQWLVQAVIGSSSDLYNDDKIGGLDTLAGHAVHGRETVRGSAWTHADWWMRYQRAIPPILATLQKESD